MPTTAIVADGAHVETGARAHRRPGRRGRHRLRRRGRGDRRGHGDAASGRDYFVVGYGENIDVPTIDVISTEINFIGNLVGSYTDLQELMVLAAQGKVSLHTSTYPLEDFQQAFDDLDAGQVRGRAILIP